MKKLTFLTILLFVTLVVVACGGSGTAAPTTDASVPTPELTIPTDEPDSPTTEAAAPDTSTCPEATEDTYLLRNPQHGYCLLYPVGHKVERPNPDEVNLVIGGLLNATDPRANIKVTAADGRTAADFADEIIAGFEGFEIDRSESTVAGETAIVLDNMPGQDINRQVIFAHDDRIYHLYFSPLDLENSGSLDGFINGILDSFTFIPVSESVTAEDECVAPHDSDRQIVSETFGYCFLAPADFTYEEPSETNANLFVGSMMDVEHPKLMIEVTDAAGQTAEAAADELVASFEGFDIMRSFGDTLGYEPAYRLDGVPGQDLGRVLMAVHNGRLYRLTFVPADPTQGDVYTQMEALFAQVLSTFRFLP